MANDPISSLPTVVNSTLADLIPAVQSGTTSQETLQQVFNLMLANTVLNYAGNPSGNVAGNIYQLCWDTTDTVLYVCTVSGSAAAATWTQVATSAFTILNPARGGTGINNGTNTITVAGNFVTSGANALTLTTTGTTNVTLPTSGTLVNSAVTTLSSLASIGTISTGTWNGSIVAGQYGGTGINNSGKTITLGGNISTANSFTTSGNFAVTQTYTGGTNVTFPTSGTLVNSAVTTLSSLTSIGTIATGVWQGTVIGSTYGGTGVNNGSSTITLGGSLTTSGAFTTTLTVTGNTSVTLPTSGTLATTSQIPTGAALTKTDDTNVTLTLGGSPTTALLNASSITAGWTGTLSGTRGGTGVNNGSSTITLGGNLVTSGSSSLTLTTTGSTNVTLPTSGTLVNTAVTTLSSLASVGTINTGTWNGTAITAVYGGTGVANPTAHTLPVAEGASNFTFIGPLTNGQLLIGSTGADPSASTLTAGTNISITNNAGAITIAATGAGGFSWTNVTGTTQTMASNSGYIANNAGLVTFTLPATSSIGDELEIVGKGAGGWTIAQGVGQQIILGSSSTTSGVGGSLASTNRRDGVYLVCTSANTEWTVPISPQGNLTVV